MERIAPLAKILAEANGIEWETLHGTGPGGQIVEQDILDYLTRVMSGEAEPPSTPVDAPPPDWDGNDVPGAGMFDAAALSKAGVESDIAEFVSQGRPAGPQIPGTATPALETSDFELDDQELVPAPAPADVQNTAQNAAPLGETSGSMISAPAAPAATVGGLGSLLSRLYHKEEPAPTTTPVAAAATPTAPSVPSMEVAPPAPVAAPEPAQAALEPQVADVPTDVVEPVPARAPEAPQVEAAAVETPIAEPAVAQAFATQTPAAAAPAPEPQVAEPQRPAEPARMPEPVTEAVAPVAPAAASAPVPTAPVSTAPVYSGPTSEVPRDAVWFGTYLRRSADLGTLQGLQAQLGEALERDVPLALMVARAAQRHLPLLGLQSVAMQNIGANQALGVGAGQSSGIRDALSAMDSHHDGTPDLLVVDAGSMGLDDLHYPHTLTLSVGRVQDGQASLSLQGEVDTGKAAQFLAKVADTLEKPVILLV
ncbi:hypothetical protein D3875_14510 [Deinococcus cavernae]|uniref:Peripheral subunit-binding (PSBD) domain-containing protein n=1 Tax=Deinococcus cavernae TaxID=2320857 RepID=A0A418V8X7_9DEIO|nr:E3 binding domain-containing protein [Deinococcus cavernae]RJF72574.1 hypothetical protein D3875_14510 [Deinococcus cavernae]